MSFCGKEFNACCTCVNTGTVSGWCWSCRIISYTCSVGDRSGDDLTGQCNMSTLVEYVALQQRESVILLKNSPLNAVNKGQYHGLNYQTDIQICGQCVWDSPESAPAVLGNFSPAYDYRCRFSV
ncbi:hypothetical protein TNCV_901771 [Trichonephila clavipes]|nr:hypothetical protein TNCV_901771 [Trichonephila clavipes]